MANIRIPTSENQVLQKQTNTIVFHTKDTYVPEDIELHVTSKDGSFNNQPTGSASSYAENTDQTTVIPADGYLYLEEGWFPKTKISLGHLIPDDSDYQNAGTNQIMSGYEAYDVDGHKLIGTLATVNPTFNGGEVTISTPTITDVDPAVTVTSSGTFVNASAYGVTGTQPSTGTDGTNYLTIDGGATQTTDGSVTFNVTANRADVLWYQQTTGNIAKVQGDTALAAPAVDATKSATFTIDTITITDNFTPLYIPIVAPKGKGGTVTAGTVTNTISGSAPSVTPSVGGTVTSTGTTTYGVTTTTPSGTYLTIIPGGTAGAAQTWTGNASIAYTRDAVVANNDYKGATSIAQDTYEFLAQGSGTLTGSTSVSVEATVGTGTTYYIPVVSTETFSGGNVTATAGGSQTTAPTVVYSASAAGKNSGGTAITLADYGVATTTGSDADGYITFTASGAAGSNGSVTATANASRAAVTHTHAAGVIEAHNNVEALAAADATEDTETITTTATPTAGATTKYRIPIVTPAAAGGNLSEETITVTGDGNISITPSVGLYNGSTSTAITDSTYGITTSEPSSGSFVRIDPDASAAGASSVSAEVTVTRGAVTVSCSPGATNGTGTGLNSTTKTYTGSTTVGTSIAAGTNKYVPVVSVPTVNATGSVTTAPSVQPAVSVSNAVTHSSTSGLTSYVTITTTSGTVNDGTVTPSATGTLNKGLTAGGTITSNNTAVTVTPTVTPAANVYIEIYDGSYTVNPA